LNISADVHAQMIFLVESFERVAFLAEKSPIHNSVIR